MSTVSKTGLLTPPIEDDIQYPYRRVWVTLSLESAILFGIATIFTIASLFYQIPRENWQAINITYALLPFGLWCIFSLGGESLAIIKRPHLLMMVLLGALTANAIGYPLIQKTLELNLWIAQTGLFERIVIVMLAFGIPHETLKYLVMRYTVWKGIAKSRYDMLAYALAVSVGYVSVFTVHYVLNDVQTPSMASIGMFALVAQQYLGSIIVSYALAQMRFSEPSIFMPSGLIGFAALLISITATLSTILANTRFGIELSIPRSPVMLAISGLALAAVIVMMSFIFKTTERQDHEANFSDR